MTSGNQPQLFVDALASNRELQDVLVQQLNRLDIAEASAQADYNRIVALARDDLQSTQTETSEVSVDEVRDDPGHAGVVSKYPLYTSIFRGHSCPFVHHLFASRHVRDHQGQLWGIDSKLGLVHAPSLTPSKFDLARWTKQEESSLVAAVRSLIPLAERHNFRFWQRLKVAPSNDAGAAMNAQRSGKRTGHNSTPSPRTPAQHFVLVTSRHSRADCFARWHGLIDPSFSKKKWSAREDALLGQIATDFGGRDWEAISRALNVRATAQVTLARATRSSQQSGQSHRRLAAVRRSPWQCLRRFKTLQMKAQSQSSQREEVRPPSWSQDADAALVKAVARYGFFDWESVPLSEELLRHFTVAECKRRWRTRQRRQALTGSANPPHPRNALSGARQWTMEEDLRLTLAVGALDSGAQGSQRGAENRSETAHDQQHRRLQVPQRRSEIAKWTAIAEAVGHGRNAKQCSSRWQRLRASTLKSEATSGPVKVMARPVYEGSPHWNDERKAKLAALVTPYNNAMTIARLTGRMESAITSQAHAQAIPWSNIAWELRSSAMECRAQWRKLVRKAGQDFRRREKALAQAKQKRLQKTAKTKAQNKKKRMREQMRKREAAKLLAAKRRPRK